MAKDSFDIKFDNVIDYTLALQDINDIAMPIAVQYTFNDVVKDAKKRGIKDATSKMFNIKKRTFFKANSGFKTGNAKSFGYNLNKISAEVGITKSLNKYDKATEQVGNQQTAKNIKRSINPLKTLSAANANVLKKKPLIYDSSINYSNVRNNRVYLSKVFKAQREKRGFIASNGKKGTLYKINRVTKRKPTKKNAFQFKISKTPLASYIKDGQVELKRKYPFLRAALDNSAANMIEKSYIKNANIQFSRAMKRRGIK